MYAKDKELFTKQPNLNDNSITRKLNYMQQVAASLLLSNLGSFGHF